MRRTGKTRSGPAEVPSSEFETLRPPRGLLPEFLAAYAGVVARTDHRAPAGDLLGPRRSVEETNRWMLRARDAIDREYARPLDIPALAKIAAVSEAHFIRTFRATFGETPHRYLQRRRVERAMALLRLTDRSVTDVCLDVGFTSLGTFSRTFRAIVGRSPSAYRGEAGPPAPVPTCFAMAWTRPSSFGEAIDHRSP